jgi:hypothetical protein
VILRCAGVYRVKKSSRKITYEMTPPKRTVHRFINGRRTAVGGLADFQGQERRAYFDQYVRSEQRLKIGTRHRSSGLAFKPVRLSHCPFVTDRSGYAPHSRLASGRFEFKGMQGLIRP